MEAQFMYEKNIDIIMGNQIATSYVRKRDCYNQLKGFMQHEYPGKICALYGLRRTGKTVMMYQYISELSDKDKEKQYIFFAYGNVICLNCGRQWKIYTIKAFATFS
mgnify:FL=1